MFSGFLYKKISIFRDTLIECVPNNTASRKRTVFTPRNFSGSSPPVGRARGWIPRFSSRLSINGLFCRMFYRIHFAHWNICYNQHFSKNTRIDCWAITLLSKRRPPFFNGLDEAPEGDASSTLLILKKT